MGTAMARRQQQAAAIQHQRQHRRRSSGIDSSYFVATMLVRGRSELAWEEGGDGGGVEGGRESLGKGVTGDELEEVAAAVGKQKERYDQNDQKEGDEHEDDWEQRRRSSGWLFGGRRWGRFAH